MKFQDLKVMEVRMLSFHNFKITAVLARDRVETFDFNSREEFQEALRLWASIEDLEKPNLKSARDRMDAPRTVFTGVKTARP
jgi:hypothetical protein